MPSSVIELNIVLVFGGSWVTRTRSSPLGTARVDHPPQPWLLKDSPSRSSLLTLAWPFKTIPSKKAVYCLHRRQAHHLIGLLGYRFSKWSPWSNHTWWPWPAMLASRLLGALLGPIAECLLILDKHDGASRIGLFPSRATLYRRNSPKFPCYDSVAEHAKHHESSF